MSKWFDGIKAWLKPKTDAIGIPWWVPLVVVAVLVLAVLF